ncbi:MAG TPA: hypothetical protein P5304_25105 [Phycisphaerae bacterium]|nr:hypothetical protein [Phycisphaerae bacterium]
MHHSSIVRNGATLAIVIMGWAGLLRAGTVSWDAGGDGKSWEDARNWSNDTLPGPGDDVTIGSGYTVEHGTGTHTVASVTSQSPLTLLSGTLEVTGAASVTNTVKLQGGVLKGATLTATSTLIPAGYNGYLDAVTLGTNLDVLDGSQLSFRNGLTLSGATVTLNTGTLYNYSNMLAENTQTLGGTGQVVFNGTIDSGNMLYASGAGATLTIGSGVTVKTGTKGGSVGTGGRTVVNQGTISAETTGKTLTIQGNYTNVGTFAASAGTLSLSGVFDATGGIGTFSHTGGNIDVTGTVKNTGATLTLNASTGDWRLAGGTIQGGTVASVDGAKLILPSGYNGYLDAVTLGTNLDVLDGSQLSFRNGLTLSGATVTLNTGTLYNYSNMLAENTQTLGGTGQVVFNGTIDSGNMLYASGAGATLTIGSGVTVKTGTKGGSVGTGGRTVVNQGTISAETTGKTLTIQGNWTNAGMIEASNGGIVSGEGTIGNYASNTLTGGTWRVFTSSTLRLTNANIITNAATIVLDGASSKIVDQSDNNALANFATNAPTGSLTLINGRSLATAGTVTNAGSAAISGGSILTVAGNYTQTGGSTTLDGGTLAAGGQVDIQAGELLGNGTVNGPLVSAGTVSPGLSPGRIDGSSSYSQSAAGGLNIEISGSGAGEYD